MLYARLLDVQGARPAFNFLFIHICCVTPPATNWPTMDKIRVQSSII